MHIFLTVCFLTHNILVFYIAFEAVTGLMFVVIIFWGYEQRRSLASFYFFYFTFFSSLFFLMGISAIYWFYGDVSWYNLMNSNTPRELQTFVWWCFAFAFAVKIPMYPFHIWLPEAHVEAPTGGSILLAAVLLKLGFYGFYKFLIPLFFLMSLKNSIFILIFALLSITHATLTAMRQVDAKRLVAYCSIAHMNLGILALFTFTFEGLLGSTSGMIAHGFVSAGLFFLIGAAYKRYGTRSVNYYGGFVRYSPIFSICFFLLILGNIAFPLTLNFIAEFQMVVSIITISFLLAAFCILGIVLNLVVSLSLFVKICYGSWKTFYIKCFSDLTKFEFIVSYVLIFFTFYFGVHPRYLFNLFDSSFINFFKPLTSFFYNSLFVEAKEIVRPLKNFTNEDLNKLPYNDLYDFLEFKTRYTLDEPFSDFGLSIFYSYLGIRFMLDHTHYVSFVLLELTNPIFRNLIQWYAYIVSKNLFELKSILATISSIDVKDPHYPQLVQQIFDLINKTKKCEERIKWYASIPNLFVEGPFSYMGSERYQLGLEFCIRNIEAFYGTLEQAEPPKNSSKNFGSNLIKNSYAYTISCCSGFKYEIWKDLAVSVAQQEVLLSLNPSRFQAMSFVLDRYKNSSFHFFAYMTFSDYVHPNLENALRYTYIPSPNPVIKRELDWPNEYSIYDLNVCYEYAANIRHCFNKYNLLPISKETFAWYSAHKPVMAAVYEALNEACFYLDGSLKLEVQRALINIVKRNEYPSLTLLKKVSLSLNLPDTNVINLLYKHGYPNLPDFEIVANDAQHIIKKNMRYKDGFPFYINHMKRSIVSNSAWLVSKILWWR
jgi:proton-translocating NADH-quinone oxidoreductase chain M